MNKIGMEIEASTLAVRQEKEFDIGEGGKEVD